MQTKKGKLNRVVLTLGCALACLLLSAQASARTSVWKVTNGNHELYLGGTIHVLSSADYPLPAPFERAYQLANTLIFETDIAALNGVEAQQKFAGLMTFQDGQTLTQAIDESTLKQLEQFLSARGIPLQNFMPFTPVGVSLTLTMLELQRLGINPAAGIDNHFSARAASDKKTLESLETLDQQLAFLRGMESLDANELILSTISEVNEMAELWRAMLNEWREGDLLGLQALTLMPMQEAYPSLTDVLLKQRNLNWMEKIPAMLKDEDIEFVLVGALHLVGDFGLISLLKQQGYQVTQLD